MKKSIFLFLILVLVAFRGSIVDFFLKDPLPDKVPSINGKVSRIISFTYGGYSFRDTLIFDDSIYTYYRNLSKTEPYENYVKEDINHAYLQKLAQKLDADANSLHYNERQMVEYLTAFVQESFPYTPDPSHIGHDYPKYPIETILENGDCEDKSALLASLLKVFGFNPKLVEMRGHMAVAISGNYAKSCINDNGVDYAFIESTTKESVGYVPDDVAGESCSLLPVELGTRYDWQLARAEYLFDTTKSEVASTGIYTYDTDDNVYNEVQINGVTIKSNGNITITQDGNTITIQY